MGYSPHMRLTFHGAARTVTGSKYLLDCGPRRILVDCGIFQGEGQDETRYNHLPFDPFEIDFVVITHGHLDHCGLLPLLAREGWTGKILSTPATRDVARFILNDSAKQISRAYGEPDYVFTTEDVERTMGLWHAVPYGKVHDLGDGISLRLHDAGHILGSAAAEIAVRRDGSIKRVVFSGDLGRYDMPIIRDPAPIPGAEVVLIESTYGDRTHDTAKNRDRLKETIKEIAQTKGHLLIPAFAIGRTQALLYELNALLEKGEIPRVPVFLDSPLGINITNTYRRHQDCFDEETKKLLAQGDAPFDFPELTETSHWKEGAKISSMAGPSVVIAGSGMINGGRILGHVKALIGDPKTMLLIVGFQAQGTLGRKLLDGADSVTIDRVEYPVRAKIRTINGFSAHADRDELCRWLDGFGKKPEQIFCTHGEPNAVDALAVTIKDRFGVQPTAPAIGDSIEI